MKKIIVKLEHKIFENPVKKADFYVDYQIACSPYNVAKQMSIYVSSYKRLTAFLKSRKAFSLYVKTPIFRIGQYLGHNLVQ